MENKIIIRRLEIDLYKLEIDGEVVSDYNQELMKHPQDWIDDALSAGLDEWQVYNGGWDVIDTRKK